MTQEPSPQSKNGKADRNSSLQGKTLYRGKPSPQISSSLQKLISTQEQGEQQSQQPQLQQVTGVTKNSQTRRRKLPQISGLKLKSTALALAASIVPVLVVGTTCYLGSQSIYKQVTQARQAGVTQLRDTEAALQRQLLSLMMDTGVTAIVAGAIAALLMDRATRPVINAANASNAVVNKLRRGNANSRDRVAGNDELITLETNIRLIEQQLPDLLRQQEAEAERSQILMKISQKIWGSLSEADVLRTTVEEARKVYKCDRVVIFRCDPNGNGSFIEESVASNCPKMLWATIDTPFFTQKDLEQYRQGRVSALDNIYQASLTDSQLGLWERFAIKASLVAPIVKDNELFGLLIAHQCSQTRLWQSPEMNLFSNLAAQAGFALERTKLLEQVDTKANQAQLFIDITHRIRESLNEEDILKTTVEEVRKAMRSDRVMVYSFDDDWYGTVVAESVVPGFPKALWARIKDPCFAEGYVDKYQAGRVQATNNIYAAGLTECHLQQLEPFAVKANLVAPILKDGKLFGLLIAHECTKPRDWQQSEIDLFAQFAAQVGFALDHARLLQRIDAESVRTQILAHVTQKIRESLNEEDILKTTVEEVRKVVRSDRVMVYSFDDDWYGTVVAESVVPGFPKALWARIKDPCFAEGYVDKYQAGRVQATNNIYAAGLTECHLQQLEPFAVKANLVAPILKDGKLFGLLIAHECTKPRDWQQSEIDLFAQFATQVGFAIDHARLLKQVEQSYQAASAASREQRQQKEALQHQLSVMLKDSETSVKTLSSEAIAQMESATAAYDRVQTLADAAQRIIVALQQAEPQIQQVESTVYSGHEIVNQTIDGIVTTKKAILDVAQKMNQLIQPTEKIPKVVDILSNLAYQLKLYAMNIKLATSRTSNEAAQEFTSIAEKVLTSAEQLDAEITEIKLLAGKIQSDTQEVVMAIEVGAEQAIAKTELVEEQEQKLNQIVTFSIQMLSLLEEISQAATNQTEASTSASQAVLEAANIANKTSQQSMAVAESFTKLAAAAQDL